MDRKTIDFADKTQFVNALLDCPTMRDRNTRNQIVDQLTKVRGRIPRSETDHIDVANIVNRALDFDGGLAQLPEVLRFYEGESRHMQNVDTLYKQLFKALEARTQEANAKPSAWASSVYEFVATIRQKKKPLGYLWLICSIITILIIWLIAIKFTTSPPILTHGEPYYNSADDATYLYIPSGKFTMGSSNEQVDYAYELCTTYHGKKCPYSFEDELPQHTVYLDSYWIMELEVTNAQYRKFMDDDGYTTEAYWSAEGWTWRETRIQPEYWEDQHFNGNLQPVVGISWYEAEAYTAWLSAKTDLDFRLPTEAQWEKAARGSDDRHFPWGNQWNNSRANYCDENCTKDWSDKEADDGYQYTAIVGSYPLGISLYGALDMAGNVREWTADWYDDDYYQNSPERNPTGPGGGRYRMLRGGSWDNSPARVRIAFRNPAYLYKMYPFVGFRLVLLPSTP